LEPNSHPSVLLVLPDLLSADGAFVEHKAVGFDLGAHNLSHHSLHRGDGVVAEAEEVEVPSRPPWHLVPGGEQHGALEDEALGVTRAAQPVEEPLHGIVDEHQLEVLAPFPGQVEQTLANRRGEILRFPSAHPWASR
jgi:hypothetical protein